ncbi:MAG: hypothetical protein M0Z54_13760 [Thermaerobacter sp.]|nr:hypothetical protein [Thermaerobacter sp.]
MWRCEACETTIPADSAFCPYCGRAVAAEPPPAPAPEPRTEPVPPPVRTPPRVRRLALTPQAGERDRQVLPRALGLAGQPIDRLVALLGGVLTIVGFLAAVARGSGGDPWLGLGIAALAASIYLRLDRSAQDP